jgi:CHASE2 domain-containing sensor protein
VNRELFWRVVPVQGGVLAVLFGLALAARLPRDTVTDYWPVAASLAWFGCALLTARVLRLPVPLVLVAALAGLVAGGLAVLVVGGVLPAIGAGTGLVVALFVFSASSACAEEPRL